MVEKIKNESRKVGVSTKITTILIVVLSILTVVAIFLIYHVQNQVKSKTDMADRWYAMLAIVDKDIYKILGEDTLKQQMALTLQQELIYMNDWIKQMKDYNITVEEGRYNQSDIDIVAMQAAIQIEILNDLIRDTFAYNWTARNGGTPENNYTYMEIENYLILNNYPVYNATLDEDLKNWINSIFFPNTPEILQVELFYWQAELYWNASIILEYGQFSAEYSEIFGLSLNDISYYEIAWRANEYEWTAELFDESVNALTSALILLTIAAVILAFVVSIKGKTYVWISLILGIVVSLIAFNMLYTGVLNYMDAKMFAI